MRIVHGVIFVWVMILVGTSAWGAGLQTRDVQGFIEVMQDLKPLFNDYADEVGDDGDAASTTFLISDWVQGLRGQASVQGVLKKHGYDFDQWAIIATQVTQAYVALKLSHQGQDALDQWQQAKIDIENNPDLPEEYKAQMLTQLQSSMAQLEFLMAASPEDQAVIQPLVPALDTIFEWTEED